MSLSPSALSMGVQPIRLLALCIALALPRVAAAEDPIAAAVASPQRPASDVARDAARRPAEILRFFELKPGQRVADLVGGSGYYSEIVARAVGPEGQVWLQNTPFVIERFAKEPVQERMARLEPELGNLTRLDSELAAPALPEKLDLVLMVLFYHDTYWQEIDRAAMNRAIHASLRPGGIFGVIDHHAEAGSGDRDVKTIHRVDAALVRQEIEAAGFVLEAESELLRHPEDDRTRNVFEPEIRGGTDRFVYRFRKPDR